VKKRVVRLAHANQLRRGWGVIEMPTQLAEALIGAIGEVLGRAIAALIAAIADRATRDDGYYAPKHLKRPR
jgi:hypothetical protein